MKAQTESAQHGETWDQWNHHTESNRWEKGKEFTTIDGTNFTCGLTMHSASHQFKCSYTDEHRQQPKLLGLFFRPL